MFREELITQAKLACSRSIEIAEQRLRFSLPKTYISGIAVEGFIGEIYTIEQSVDLFLQNGSFPFPVDLVVRGLIEDKSLIIWIPCGEDIAWLPQDPTLEFGPFKPMGLMVPSRYGTSTLSEMNAKSIGEDWSKGTW